MLRFLWHQISIVISCCPLHSTRPAVYGIKVMFLLQVLLMECIRMYLKYVVLRYISMFITDLSTCPPSPTSVNMCRCPSFVMLSYFLPSFTCCIAWKLPGRT